MPNHRVSSTDALKVANANHERFERLYYLEADKTEKLLGTLTAIRCDLLTVNSKEMALEMVVKVIQQIEAVQTSMSPPRNRTRR